MFRKTSMCVATLAALGFASLAEAQQVRVRVPFVDVDVGPGIRVRAPFVNLWFPTRPRVVVAPTPPPPPIAPAQPIPPVQQTPPAIQNSAVTDEPLPAPIKTVRGALTTREFVQSFTPREGVHEVTLMNPFTKAGNSVRFTLPAGAPERVLTDEQKIEFVYGPRRFVRIEFDEDGPIVTSR